METSMHMKVEQLSLFPSLFDPEPETPAVGAPLTLAVPVTVTPACAKDAHPSTASSARTERPAVPRPKVPSCLTCIKAPEDNDLGSLLRRISGLGIDYESLTFSLDRTRVASIDRDRIRLAGSVSTRYSGFFETEMCYDAKVQFKRSLNGSDIFYRTTLVYVDYFGNAWMSILTVNVSGKIPEYKVNSIEMTPWKLAERIPENISLIQYGMTLTSILESVNPYAAKFCETEGYDPALLLIAPWIETLHKAGYAFVPSHLKELNSTGAMEEINRLCRPGRSPKEIFKTSKAVMKVLRDETDMKIWDCYRRLDKFGRLKTDSIEQAYSAGLRERDLELVSSILGKHWNGRPVFSWESLVNYLGRVDQFEAIGRDEALILLRDYLNMCSTLGLEPRIDGDSLKREHDIAARLSRYAANDKLRELMDKGCKVAERYNYSEAVYTVSAITDYDTLMDEARQQHNCVASYAKAIAEGKSLIFSMRETAHPEQSLITIETSPDGCTIRQKLLAYNRPIHNRSQTEFIERWTRHCRALASKQ